MILNKKIFFSVMTILILLVTGCKKNEELHEESHFTTTNKLVNKVELSISVYGKNQIIDVLLANKVILDKEVEVNITVQGVKKGIILLFENAQSQMSKVIIPPNTIISFRKKVKVINSKKWKQAIFQIPVITNEGLFSFNKENSIKIKVIPLFQDR